MRRWAFPLVVIGMNSITASRSAHLFGAFISSSLNIHLGTAVFRTFGPAYGATLHGVAVLFVMWLILLWMFRRKVSLRI